MLVCERRFLQCSRVKVCSCVCAGSFYFLQLAVNLFFLEQAADSSLDYYLDFYSFTGRHLSFVLSVHYSSSSGILSSLPAVHDCVTYVHPEASILKNYYLFIFLLLPFFSLPPFFLSVTSINSLLLCDSYSHLNRLHTRFCTPP